ncbi:MAG: nucleotidyl transferase AbiEii/AbiGii toxin family protein [Bacteroidota bacterium]
MNGLKMLLPDTEKVLQQLSTLTLLDNYSFVGGSALTIYLSHRYSEVIDLFTWETKINSVYIQQQIEKAGFKQVQIINLSANKADFIINNVDVTFFASGWSELKKRKSIKHHLFIADLNTIAVMKINTLFMRAKFRDYYDLYVLNLNHFTLKKLYEMTSERMKNLSKTLFQKAIVFTEDIEDENIKHLNPKYNVTLKQIEDHFAKEIKKWNNE